MRFVSLLCLILSMAIFSGCATTPEGEASAKAPEKKVVQVVPVQAKVHTRSDATSAVSEFINWMETMRKIHIQEKEGEIGDINILTGTGITLGFIGGVYNLFATTVAETATLASFTSAVGALMAALIRVHIHNVASQQHQTCAIMLETQIRLFPWTKENLPIGERWADYEKDKQRIVQSLKEASCIIPTGYTG